MTGRTVVRNHDWVSTETLFRSALQVAPQNAKAHALIGGEMKYKQSTAEHEQALEHYQTALGIYPDYMKEDPEFASHLGDVLFILGRTSEAVAVLEKAVTLSPHWGLYLGLAHARLGQHDKAERAWRDALAFTPKHPEIRSKLSRLLLERGRYEEGLAAAEVVLKDYPDFVLALYNRALALEALGRLEEAAAAYERVRALPSAPEAARQDADRKLHELRTRVAPERPGARPCIPGLAGC